MNQGFRNTMLVAKREYLERVRSRVFRITTLLVPVGLAALFVVGQMGDKKLAAMPTMAVVSNDPSLAAQVKNSLGQNEGAPKAIEVYAPVTPEQLQALNQQVSAHKLDGYLDVETQPGQRRPKAAWVSANSVDMIRKSQMQSAVRGGLVREELLARGMSPGDVQALLRTIDLQTMQLKQGKAVTLDAGRSFGGAYALIVVLYGSVLIYGINVARSVVEEKTSRIFEVLLSTASSDSLMMGKLLGVGAAGLTQMGIWAALLLLFTGSQIAAGAGIHGLKEVGVTGTELAFFAVFFLLGFLLYSALAAALGSTVSAEQEIQQFSFILISPLVLSVVLLPYVLGNPSSTGAVVLSLLPPFTPIILYMRICAQMPPTWQIVLGIGLLVASVWWMIWLAARIYRVGVLMYGKRATVPEILRWLKYS